MTTTPAARNQVIGCMATFPERFAILRRTIGSIAPQLDRLYLYVNGTTDGLPQLSDLGDIVILDGRDHAGDLSANGKVYPLKFASDCEVFGLDDDFIFPPDYVRKNLTLLRRFGGRCAATTHGSILPPTTDWYYERSHVFVSVQGLAALQICTLAGSGTFCFDQRHLVIDIDDLLKDVMVDLKLSLAARTAGLPIFVLPRPEGWLTAIRMDGLWERFSKDDLTPHTYLARTFDWSFERYRDLVLTAMNQADVTAQDIGLDENLAQCLKTGDVPTAWKVSSVSYRTRARYLDLLSRMTEAAPA